MAVIPLRTSIFIFYLTLLIPYRSVQYQMQMFSMGGMLPPLPAPEPMPMPMAMPVAAAPIMQQVMFSFRITTTTTEKPVTALSFQLAVPMPFHMGLPTLCLTRPRAPECSHPPPPPPPPVQPPPPPPPAPPAPFGSFPLPYPQVMYAPVPVNPLTRMIHKKHGSLRRMLNNDHAGISLNDNANGGYGFKGQWNPMFKPMRLPRSVNYFDPRKIDYADKPEESFLTTELLHALQCGNKTVSEETEIVW